MSALKPFFSEALPTELALEILNLLDSSSILTALKVWPGLRESTLLITDHLRPPKFFGVPDNEIRQKYFKHKYCEPPTEDVYKGADDHALIKLFECAHYTTFNALWSDGARDETDGRFIKRIKAARFLFHL